MFGQVQEWVCRGGADMVMTDSAKAALQRVAAGMLGGVGPREFQAGIEAGHRELGNRAFLRWVGEWPEEGGRQMARSSSDEVTEAGMPVAPSRLSAPAPLQLMPKKKKKTGGSVVDEAAEATREDLPESVAQAQAECEIPLSPVQPEESTGPGQKKKKKPRVKVALNTLRGEGVEAFKAYIEAEIGETGPLRTLVERIIRAEDLGGIKNTALKAVEARLRVLDPEAVAGAPEAAVPGPGRARPDIAPVKAELSSREDELFGCCASGNVRRLKQLLRYGKIDINMGSKYGTLLNFASYNGHAGLVRELLSLPGIDVNLAHQIGMTSLYIAAQEDHAEVVKLLLAARGINVNLSAHTGATPLYVAAQERHVEVVKLLLATPGINVNLAEMAGAAPLCIAAQEGQEEVVKLLLDAPTIRIDARKANGATALIDAAASNFPRIVELLIKGGANVNLMLDAGSTALSAAAYRGYLEVVRVLLQAPAIEVNHTTKSVISPLAMACANGHRDVTTLLLEKGAYPNITFESGIAPLHLACLRGHTAIVEILLNAGVDMDDGIAVETAYAGTEIHTPYGIAELMGHREVMTLLEQHRQDRSARAVQVEALSPCLRPAEPAPLLTTAGAGSAKAGGQALEDEPGRSSSSSALPEPASLPTAAPAVQKGQIPLTSPAAAESRATGGREPADRAPPSTSPEPIVSGNRPAPAEPPTPLALGKQELIQEILKKLERDNLEPLEGIRLLAEVRASASIDGLCGIYNRLAGIERRSERARRRGGRRRELAVGVEAQPVAGGAPRFELGEKADLDADAVEDEIKGHLGQAYHRFVSQAVNDMEFGRGKPTSGYPGLWHVSVGISGVGSCSVFYYLDGSGERIRMVGIGHHAGRATYRLDYADEDLGDSKRTLRIA